MSFFARLRQFFFPIDLPDFTERDRISAHADEQAIEQTQRAIALMQHWSPERAEELRRFMRTGNFAEGELMPERRRDRT